MQKVVRPTGLKAIADEVDVSVSLVSKVLNNRLGNSRVAPKTISAIHAAAQALGYRKNHAAAALVSGRQNVIGGFVHQLGLPSSGIADQLVRGMVDGAARHGRRLMLRFFNTTEEFLAYSPEITSSLLDGLIIAGIRHDDLRGKFAEFEAAGVPIVTVHELQKDGEDLPPNIYIDQRDVCDIATEHLIAQGCRRIAHLRQMSARADGYIRALQRHGLPVDEALIFPAHYFTHEWGARGVAYFLSRQVAFDGLVAQSDEQAVGAMNALAAAGIGVPDDVKVIGVDNSPFCDLLPTPLSSVSTEFYAQGVCAMDMLVQRIDRRPTASVRIVPLLKPRGSSTPRGTVVSDDSAAQPQPGPHSLKGVTHVW